MKPPSVASLFEQHAPYVGRMLRYMGVPDADLEDACQEVFVVVHRKIASLRPDASPRGWLYGICLNEARGRTRARRARREDQLDGDLGLPDPQSGHDARHAARQTALGLLAVLDEDKRTVFLLHDVEQVPMHEICDMLDIPLQTGYSRLRLGRERLRAAVARERARGEP